MTHWTLADQAPLSVEFSRQEYWSGFQILTPGDPPDPGIEFTSLAPPVLAVRFITTAASGKNPIDVYTFMQNNYCAAKTGISFLDNLSFFFNMKLKY